MADQIRLIKIPKPPPLTRKPALHHARRRGRARSERRFPGRRRQVRRRPHPQHPAADHPSKRSWWAPMFTSDLLSQMIRFYGKRHAGMMGKYLESNIKAFTDMQAKLQDQVARCMAKTPRSARTCGPSS